MDCFDDVVRVVWYLTWSLLEIRCMKRQPGYFNLTPNHVKGLLVRGIEDRAVTRKGSGQH